VPALEPRAHDVEDGGRRRVLAVRLLGHRLARLRVTVTVTVIVSVAVTVTVMATVTARAGGVRGGDGRTEGARPISLAAACQSAWGWRACHTVSRCDRSCQPQRHAHTLRHTSFSHRAHSHSHSTSDTQPHTQPQTQTH
jgi:hypothetical protein